VSKFRFGVVQQLPPWLPARLGPVIFRGILMLLVTISLSGCVANLASLALSDPDSNAHTAWTREDVAGHTMTLIDPNQLETFQFADGGIVIANVGKGDADFQWRIVKGMLQINDRKASVEELTLVTINGAYLLATRKNGQLVKYRYQ